MKKTLTLGSKTLSYVEKGSGPAVVLGPSFLWTAEMWAAQVEGLASEFRCIVPELWGHGASGTLEEEAEVYTVERLTDDMAAFVDGLGLGRFSMVGLSVGGMWGARLAHRMPERVEKLVLMDTDLGEEPPESRERFLGMIAMAEQAGGFPPPLAEACLPFFFCDATLKEKPEVVEAFRRSLLDWSSEKIATVTALGRGIFTRLDFLASLKEIRCPALVMAGEEDRSRPPEEARRLAEHLPKGELKLIPGAGHIPSVEQPRAVTEALRVFLRGRAV